MSSSGINRFKRRCMSPFTCQSGRLLVEPSVNFGCKCATEGNAGIAACHICEHRAGEYGQHCTKCNGGMVSSESSAVPLAIEWIDYIAPHYYRITRPHGAACFDDVNVFAFPPSFPPRHPRPSTFDLGSMLVSRSSCT